MNLRTKNRVIALTLVLATARLGSAGAQDTSTAALLAQRGGLAESILAAKERALGEPFDASMRASLKSRMESLPLEQLKALAEQGEAANLPLALGSVTSDLVYTPVTPCRVFDSRPSAGGPGPIAANSQWNVFVAGTVGFPAQGGAVGGCGVPVGATSAIINFVTVLPAGPGNIRAWAVASPQPPAPLAALMNYGSVVGLPALANGVAVPLCNPAATSCTLGDLRLQADTSATNILGDVVGYFGAAAGGYVDLTTAQTVGGSKTFSSPIVADVTGSAASVTGIVPIASGGTGSATQNFVDLTTAQTVGGSKTFSSPIVGSVSGSAASVTGIVPIASGGTGSATQNFVDLTNAQTVGGVKTFSSPIVGSVSGSAASVTGIVPIASGGTGSATQNFVDLTNAQTVGGVKTFSSPIVGSVSGSAASVTGTVAITTGGTGATTATNARTNLGLGTLATVSPTGTANATTFLRGDSTWASTGAMGGTGTVNFLPAFTAATTLGNSVIQQAQPSGWSNMAVGFGGTPGSGTWTSPVGVSLQATVSEGNPNGYGVTQLVVEGTLASSASAQAYMRGIVVTPAFNFSAGYGNFAEGVYISAPNITAGFSHVVSSLGLAQPAAGPPGTSCSAALGILMPNQSGNCPVGQNRVWSIYNGSANNSFFAGNVGVGQALPTRPIETGAGAYVTVGGVWTNASSRELKKDIRPLPGDEAAKTLAALLPVTFRYKADDEAHVGFIAEDVPDLVAARDRKGLSAMDIVAVLAKVVQQQQQELSDQRQELDALKALFAMGQGKR